MKASVVTVCYNSAATIGETIESVLSQDQEELEYIIIDGGSTDGTQGIVEKYEGNISYFVSEPDKGIYDAMNKGLRQASGDVIGMLNSDDIYIDSSIVSKMCKIIEEDGKDTAFADLLIVDPKDTSCVRRYYDSSFFSPERLRMGWMPAHPSLFVRRDIYERCGEYALHYSIASDFEMIVRLYHNINASYTYLSEPIIRMRAGGVSTAGLRSTIKLNMEIVRACRAHGIKSSLPMILSKGPRKLLEVFRGRRYAGN